MPKISSIILPKTIRRLTSGSGTYGLSRWFFVSAANATAGATYTNNGVTFTVGRTITAGSLLYCQCDAAWTPSGNVLTKASGTGDATITFTKAVAPRELVIEMVGGGAGGSGSGTSQPVSTAGGNTTFGTSLLTANGGSATTLGPGLGGSFTVNSPAINVRSSNGRDGSWSSWTSNLNANTNIANGAASITPLGLFGAGGTGAQFYTAGLFGPTGHGGLGGGAGGYVNAIIQNPNSTYSYAVGASGAGGAAGGSGFAGNAGGSGIIIIEEIY